MSTSRNPFRNQCGLTLIELMTSLAIGLVLLALMVEIYLDAKGAQQVQVAINDIEFNAKRTITILASEVKRAGHIGCARLTADFPLNQNNVINVGNIIHGSDKEIQVRYSDLPGAAYKDMNAGTLLVSDDIQFNDNDVLMIADCKKAEVFHVKSVKTIDHTQYIIPNAPLINAYDDNAEIGKVIINRYFVGHNEEGKSLYVEDIDNKKLALVDNVTDLTFKYTIKQGNQIIDVPANQVKDWSLVIGVAADIKIAAKMPALEKIWHMYVAIPST